LVLCNSLVFLLHMVSCQVQFLPGVSMGLILNSPKPPVCSAIQSVGGASIVAAGRQPAAAAAISEQH
jgi:hypothetical protein